jgi:hypothetical protein
MDNNNQEDGMKELTGLTEWLSTFPQVDTFPHDKENASVSACVEFLSNKSMARYVSLQLFDIGRLAFVSGKELIFWLSSSSSSSSVAFGCTALCWMLRGKYAMLGTLT